MVQEISSLGDELCINLHIPICLMSYVTEFALQVLCLSLAQPKHFWLHGLSPNIQPIINSILCLIKSTSFNSTIKLDNLHNSIIFSIIPYFTNKSCDVKVVINNSWSWTHSYGDNKFPPQLFPTNFIIWGINPYDMPSVVLGH